MIVHKFWRETRLDPFDQWMREGWFLFGLIPLYIRDRENRNKL